MKNRIIHIQYCLTFTLLMLTCCSRSQSLIKKILTYEQVGEKKLLSRIDSFDRKGNMVLEYIFRGYLIKSTGEEEKETKRPQVMRHFEYDRRGRLLKEYNEYPGGRKTSPAFYEWTDTTITGYEIWEEKKEKTKMWQYTINGAGDTVLSLQYGGADGELASGQRSSFIYDNDRRVIEKRKFVLIDPLKMIWESTNYMERCVYSGISASPDSVYNYFKDSDSLVFITINRYNSKGQLEERINKSDGYYSQTQYIYGSQGIEKITENNTGMEPHTVIYSYDSKGRIKEKSELKGEKVVGKYWYINEYY